MAQQSTEYGYRQGNDRSIIALPMAASVVLKKAGGAFVKTDGSGNGLLAVAADAGIVGHLRFNEDFTTSATAAATVLPCDTSVDSIYELPIGSGSTWNVNYLGQSRDLIVESNIQKVDLTAAAKGVVIVVGAGTTNAAGTVISVLVKINPAKLVQR